MWVSENMRESIIIKKLFYIVWPIVNTIVASYKQFIIQTLY